MSDEPRLTIRRTTHRRVPLLVRCALPLALVGLLSLLITGNALRPFERITVIESRMASKSDYFRDPEVERLLLKHGIRVDIRRLGSRGIATRSLKGLDVVFPSGQPAAKLILDRPDDTGQTVRPFVSPLALGSFRDYAETLVKAGVATPQRSTNGDPTLYYDLDMAKFMTLLDGVDERNNPSDGEGTQADTWNGIGYDDVAAGDRSNSGSVLVRTSNVCESNSAGTYLSLLAFVANGEKTPGSSHPNDPKRAEEEVDRISAEIKPLVTLQGMWADEQADSYFSALGESLAPVALIYEHQFLAHQIAHHGKNGKQDTSRVLLYPKPFALTEPQLISLSPQGDRLVELIEEDAELRQRALELGFRIRVSGEDGASKELDTYLDDHGIQVPVPNRNQTKALEPSLDVLDDIINYVGDCPPPNLDDTA
ncbi:hypothetical protein I2W78_28375 [Streptomyces spinoverrucosus]|uniref:hypothetical protein n=1 Tax=Streptomyces spinoverrucosus TaxID=284043 RepID=UPI0018C3C2C1|nr:hypothetical protein [Streptomyces spinoverrucosus]MBG0855657.1 hypothetical protein [Streptomyces spinoverrucosus]